MVLVPQQPQPQGIDGESQPLLQKHLQTTSQATPRQSLAKRVLKVGGVLVAIDLLLCTLFVFLNPHWIRFDRHPSADDYETYGLPHADKCGREPQWFDSDVVERNRRWFARGNLTLPLSKEGLYFVAEGAVNGKVEFVEDPSLKDYAIIDFHVEHDGWVFAQTKFCMLENITGSGIGIFGPRYTPGRRSTLAEVTVRLPEFSKPFEVENVVVSVPIFKVHFGDINVKPSAFSVRSVTGDISVNNIEADRSDIRVDTGHIRGNFTVTESLALKTTTGSIVVNISMLSNATVSQEPPTAASIKTNTGAINTRFSLFAIDAKDKALVPSGGSFLIDTKSDTSGVRIKFDDAPVESTLVLTSKTSTGSINADLRPTYEGTFSLSSSLSSPVVNVKDEVEDPAGEGRKRTVKVVRARGHAVVGEVTWGDTRVGGSRVDLKSDVGTPRLSL